MSTTNPLLRYALQLGFTIAAGSKHWHATHPGGGRAIIPFGRKRHPRSDRNIDPVPPSRRWRAGQPASARSSSKPRRWADGEPCFVHA